MFNLETNNPHSFIWQEKLHTITYSFTHLDGNERKLTANPVWLVIHLDHSVIKVSKSGTILKQPKEIIEKIVEREVKDYLSNEVIEQL